MIDERWPRVSHRALGYPPRAVGKFLEWPTRQGSSLRIPAGSAAIAIRSATETSSGVDSKQEDQSDYYQNNLQRAFSIHGVLLSG